MIGQLWIINQIIIVVTSTVYLGINGELLANGMMTTAIGTDNHYANFNFGIDIIPLIRKLSNFIVH